MPIYEFKCLKCNDVFEILIRNEDESINLKCPGCHAKDLERVLSATRYSIGGGQAAPQSISQTRTCSSGSCTTYNIPGPK